MMNFLLLFTSWSVALRTALGSSLAWHHGGNKCHQKLLVLKKSSIPVIVTPPSFDQGPIQPIKPMTTLAFDL